MRRVPTAVLTAVALLCAGCGSSSSSSAPSSSSNTVTALGATTAAWASAHTADSKFPPGIVYDADSSVPAGAQYSGVMHQNGHVLSYDFKIVWFLSKPTCAQMLVKSAMLGKELAAKSVGDPTGTAFVEFLSGPTDNSYSPSSVNEASLQSFPPTSPSRSPGC